YQAERRRYRQHELRIGQATTRITRDDPTEPLITPAPSATVAAKSRSSWLHLYPQAPEQDCGNHREITRSAFGRSHAETATNPLACLSEAKTHREDILSSLGIEVVEPLWNRSSTEIMHEFLASGIRAKIVMTRADRLGESYIGRELDRFLVDVA